MFNSKTILSISVVVLMLLGGGCVTKDKQTIREQELVIQELQDSIKQANEEKVHTEEIQQVTIDVESCKSDAEWQAKKKVIDERSEIIENWPSHCQKNSGPIGSKRYQECLNSVDIILKDQNVRTPRELKYYNEIYQECLSNLK